MASLCMSIGRASQGVPERLIVAPTDLRAVDPFIAEEILAGRFPLAGRLLEVENDSPFLQHLPSKAFAERLHAFSWMRHMRALKTAKARNQTRAIISSWLAIHGHHTSGIAWEPHVTTERVIAFDLSLSGPRYAADAATTAFYHTLQERLAALGGVQAVGLTSHLPMYNFGFNGEMTREGGNPWGAGENPLVEYRYYAGDYLKALRIPLLRGRQLDERDKLGTNAVLINQVMADKFWPGQDPIGRHFGQGRAPAAGRTNDNWYEVVGVIGNVRSFGLAATTPYEFYRNTDQVSYRTMTVVIRSNGIDPGGLVPTARAPKH